MSQTEREAIEAGTVWWDGELFSGRPDWKKLLSLPAPKLTAEEQRFLDHDVDELCGMVTDWETTQRLQDMPPHVWQFIKDRGFLGMIIPKEYGGLGFSAYAHSQVITKLSTRSGSVVVSVLVPNSLGPGELLLHYGTDEQKRHYLPRLAKGLEIPCFALTNPSAGSDAASIPDYGIVCWGEHEGKRVLGLRVTWDKRYITLGPVATLLGLAFRAVRSRSPGRATKEDIGITCALIPTSHPGRAHRPAPHAAQRVFQNGPNSGDGVFIPMDWVIGGQPMLGRGWRMLMECLAAGRGISLPSSNTGDGEARGAHDRRLCARPHAVQDADRQLRGHRGSARADGRQPLHDGRDARAHRHRGRPGREARGAVRHRQVAHHRARPRGHQRRDGHRRRQGHLHGPVELPRRGLHADAGRRSPSRAPTS